MASSWPATSSKVFESPALTKTLAFDFPKASAPPAPPPPIFFIIWRESKLPSPQIKANGRIHDRRKDRIGEASVGMSVAKTTLLFSKRLIKSGSFKNPVLNTWRSLFSSSATKIILLDSNFTSLTSPRSTLVRNSL